MDDGKRSDALDVVLQGAVALYIILGEGFGEGKGLRSARIGGRRIFF